MDLQFDGVRAERERGFVLEIPSLRLRGARTTAILGPNGSGKTTLLRLIAGLERPLAGRIEYVGAVPSVGAALRRPDIALVFQEQVVLRRSVRENLELGLRLRGVDKTELRARVEDAASLLGIGHLLARRADRLSGGEGRRVSLARALCLRAPLVLLDEPLEGLDERTYVRLLDELPRLLAAFSATTVLVTHDRHEALRLAQDLVVMVDGRVHAAGDKHDVVTNPRATAVAEVLGYSVLTVNGRSVAVPPRALRPGAGDVQWSMRVEHAVDLVESREIVGRIDDVLVHVDWPPAGATPSPGDRITVHATRFYDLD
jgi:ABC-type sugar transport system ATPase subunit